MAPRKMKVDHIPFAIRQLSDAELSAELRNLDQQSGPVTEATRALYQRLLVRARRAAQEQAQQPVVRRPGNSAGSVPQEKQRDKNEKKRLKRQRSEDRDDHMDFE